MYTITLLCFIILASPLVQSQTNNATALQYNITVVTGAQASSETNSSTGNYPQAREGSCLQIKSDGSSLYLFGGLVPNGNGYSVAPSNLWQYTFATSIWGVLLNSSVTPRPAGRESMSCWVNAGNQLTIYGGDTSASITTATLYGDQFIYNSTSWNNVTSTPGVLSGAATWRTTTTTFVYGGYIASAGTTTGAIKTFVDTTRAWTTRTTGVASPVYTGTSPNPGARSRMAFATASSTVGWIFGGAQSPSVVYGDLWSFSLTQATTTNKWTFVSGKTSTNNISIADNMPPCMASSVMAITTLGNILLYGGYEQMNGAPKSLSYLWKYSVSSGLWTLFSGATAFSSAVAPASLIAYTPDLAGGVYMFGGADNSTSASLTNALYHLAFTECGQGYFVNSSGMCSPCPAGTIQGKGVDSCTKCAAGTFNSVPGVAATSCQPCLLGTYASGTGSAVCTPCGLGLVTSTTGSTSCKKCTSAGYYGFNGTCTPCPVGTYIGTAGNATCLPCPPGTSTNKTATTICSACSIGTYSTGGATSCTNCPIGFISTTTGASYCTPISPGSAAVGLTTSGTYQNTSSTSTSYTCDFGTYSDSYGAASCSLCPVGTSSGKGQAVCSVCIPGQQGKGLSVGSSNCGVCPTYRISATFGQQYCDYCPYGSVPSLNQTYCVLCPLGTYHNGFNTDGCQTGTFGFIPCCSPCPAGTYNDVQGATTCTPCAKGFFSAGTHALYCDQCPVNTRSVNGTSCVNCPEHTYSPGGSQWCSPTGY